MSDTAPIDLVSTGWTDISTAAGNDGFITNIGGVKLVYIESAAAPSDANSKGHWLNQGASINYSITAGAIYARTKRGSGRVAVTGS